MDDSQIVIGEQIELIWRHISFAFDDITIQLKFLFEFVEEHEICLHILVCFLISASVIILKRIFSSMLR